MTDALKQERGAFEAWYVAHTFNFERDPIGSRECGLRWEAWQARAALAAPQPVIPDGMVLVPIEPPIHAVARLPGTETEARRTYSRVIAAASGGLVAYSCQNECEGCLLCGDWCGNQESRLAVFKAAITAPQPAAPHGGPAGDEWISEVARDIAELDHGSPEGEPNVMLVTHDELRVILERHSQPAAPQALDNPSIISPDHSAKDMRRLSALWRYGNKVLPSAPVSFNSFLFQLDMLIDSTTHGLPFDNSTLPAQAVPQPEPVLDERKAFELWAESQFGPILRDPKLEYTYTDVRAGWRAWQARASQPVRVAQAVPPTMPPAYMLAKLQMVMPLFQESRDALTAITEQQRKLHGISPTLAERMDEAGTFSLDDWQSSHGIKQPGSEAC